MISFRKIESVRKTSIGLRHTAHLIEWFSHPIDPTLVDVQIVRPVTRGKCQRAQHLVVGEQSGEDALLSNLGAQSTTCQVAGEPSPSVGSPRSRK